MKHSERMGPFASLPVNSVAAEFKGGARPGRSIPMRILVKDVLE
jgi:hypothetical protein